MDITNGQYQNQIDYILCSQRWRSSIQSATLGTDCSSDHELLKWSCMDVNWTIKKAESRRIDAFELWCWEDSWESLGLQGDPTGPS